MNDSALEPQVTATSCLAASRLQLLGNATARKEFNSVAQTSCPICLDVIVDGTAEQVGQDAVLTVMVPATAGSIVVALACPSLPLRPFPPHPTQNHFTAQRVALT